jgi:hypothetical protein
MIADLVSGAAKQTTEEAVMAAISQNDQIIVAGIRNCHNLLGGMTVSTANINHTIFWFVQSPNPHFEASKEFQSGFFLHSYFVYALRKVRQ